MRGKSDLTHVSEIILEVLDYLEYEREEELRLVLPFEVLSADNRRIGVMKGRVLLSREYRSAKEAVAILAMSCIRGQRPRFEGDVELVATLYEPDKRRRDPGNYRKLVTDALEGIAYHDDKQIVSETWKRGGVDKANPRLEITLEAA